PLCLPLRLPPLIGGQRVLGREFNFAGSQTERVYPAPVVSLWWDWIAAVTVTLGAGSSLQPNPLPAQPVASLTRCQPNPLPA
ncbi:MAG: hypothetical protein ACK55S_15450, partial [Planctomycetota bacterium]